MASGGAASPRHSLQISARCGTQLQQLPDEEALKAFVFDTCKAEANWNMKNFIEDQVALIREQVGDKKVLLALSGGVDSSVVAALLIKAIGKQLVCVHVNHGLMRKNESEGVIAMFEKDLEEILQSEGGYFCCLNLATPSIAGKVNDRSFENRAIESQSFGVYERSRQVRQQRIG